MRYVVQRTGFRFPRGLLVLLLIVGALVAVAFWIGPFRPIPAELRLTAWDTPPGQATQLRDIGEPGHPRFPVILALQNDGGRVAEPVAVHLSLPAVFRLQGSNAALQRERVLGNPLVRYELPITPRRVAPDGRSQVLGAVDTIFIEPQLADYYCTALADSVPEFVPAPAANPEQLAKLLVFYSFEERNSSARETGLLQLRLDPAALQQTPAPVPPVFPAEMREPEIPRPVLGPLREGGTRVSFCGDPQQPLELYTVTWETPSGGRFMVIYLNGAPRKQLFDLDRDSIVELEMWDPDGDGRMEARRPARYPIPSFLLPERRPEAVAATDSVLDTPEWQSLFADTSAGPFRFTPDSLVPHLVPRPAVDTTAAAVDTAGPGTPPAGPPVTVPPPAVVDSVFLRKFNDVKAGPFRFSTNPPPLRAKPAPPPPPRRRGPIPLGRPVPYPPPVRPDTTGAR